MIHCFPKYITFTAENNYIQLCNHSDDECNPYLSEPIIYK